MGAHAGFGPDVASWLADAAHVSCKFWLRSTVLGRVAFEVSTLHWPPLAAGPFESKLSASRFSCQGFWCVKHVGNTHVDATRVYVVRSFIQRKAERFTSASARQFLLVGLAVRDTPRATVSGKK